MLQQDLTCTQQNLTKVKSKVKRTFGRVNEKRQVKEK